MKIKATAFIPNMNGEATQFNVRFYRRDNNVLVKEITVPMNYEPLSRVDRENHARLEAEVDRVLSELPRLC